MNEAGYLGDREMKISELIKGLEKVLAWNGDITIEARNAAGDYDTIEGVEVEPDSIHKDNTQFTAYIS